MLRTAFGSTIAAALADPTVIEVMVNPDGKLWIERATIGRRSAGERIGATEAERIIRLVAAHVRREVTDRAPIVSAELPETGERFEGVMPPVAPAPCFSIRKPAQVLYRLQDYVAARIMTPPQAQLLREAVKDRRNILVVGGTASGKTTLVNALLAEGPLRETRRHPRGHAELQCAADDVVSLLTKPGVASLAELVRSTLRLRPDRIVVGEVRDGAALEVLKAWNTGHPGGLLTLHANSAAAGLYRLEQLVQEAVVTVPRTLIVEAIDIVVFLSGRGANLLRRDAAGGDGSRCQRRVRAAAFGPPGPAKHVRGSKPHAVLPSPADPENLPCRGAGGRSHCLDDGHGGTCRRLRHAVGGAAAADPGS